MPDYWIYADGIKVAEIHTEERLTTIMQSKQLAVFADARGCGFRGLSIKEVGK